MKKLFMFSMLTVAGAAFGMNDGNGGGSRAILKKAPQSASQTFAGDFAKGIAADMELRKSLDEAIRHNKEVGRVLDEMADKLNSSKSDKAVSYIKKRKRGRKQNY